MLLFLKNTKLGLSFATFKSEEFLGVFFFFLFHIGSSSYIEDMNRAPLLSGL